MMIRYGWILLLISLPLLVKADVYEHRDAQGHVTYSDQPSPNATKVKLAPTSVVHSADSTAIEPEEAPASTGQYTPIPEKPDPNNKPPAGQLPSDQMKDELPAATYYKTFSLTSPTSKQTFQNQRNITLQVSVDPELREGNTVQFLLDGNLYGEPQPGTSTTLSNVDRGQHTVQAQLLDKQGNVAKSSEKVTIFIHYASAQ